MHSKVAKQGGQRVTLALQGAWTLTPQFSIVLVSIGFYGCALRVQIIT